MKKIIIGIIMTITSIYANQLKNEQSPYLLQHADNPVAWMPWKKSTLELAKKEHKMIFLSIGYSTCHWCHVMEHESFEKQDIADALGKDYIAIKVDREEMPQLDNYYMQVYQVMNGRGGGWPLTVIMTPDAKPFWSATYLPHNDLLRVLKEISKIYHNDPERVAKSTDEITTLMSRIQKQKSKSANVDLNKSIEVYNQAVNSSFDNFMGGFGTAPKFPRATLLESMLDLYSINHDKKLLKKVEITLDSMADGGIYDQIEGGFFRYSVDDQWQIPHFEKMLYTQAEMLRVYTKAYLITHDERYKTIAKQLIDFVNKRFDYNGLLYSASDADSKTPNGDKEEGYYFVFDYQKTYDWLQKRGYTKDEIKKILKYFHISKLGNFENNTTNPYIEGSKVPSNIKKIKEDLLSLRERSPYPFIDTKILTAWNANYISALALASKIDPKYGDEAIKRADKLLHSLYIDGKLYHQKLPRKPLKVQALFEDYAFLTDILTDLYEIDYNHKYIALAQKFAKEAINKFYKENRWYLSDDAYKTAADSYDSSYASAASVMERALFKLALQTDDLKLYKIAKESLDQNPSKFIRYPDGAATAFSTLLGYKKGYKILKSTKELLLSNREKIDNPYDPYLLTRAIEDLDKPLFIACTMQECFATDKSLDVVLKKIEQR